MDKKRQADISQKEETLSKKHKYEDQETVPICVGETRSRYLVHKDILCEASTFFKAALSSGFKEGNEKSVTLPEDDPRQFSLFIDWLYRGKPGLSQDYSDLGDHLVFARKYDIPNTTCDVVQTLHTFMQEGLDIAPPFFLVKLWNITDKDSGFRRLALDWCTESIDASSITTWLNLPQTQEHLNEAPDFVFAILKRLASRLNSYRLWRDEDWESYL